jgi:hypothetical protein
LRGGDPHKIWSTSSTESQLGNESTSKVWRDFPLILFWKIQIHTNKVQTVANLTWLSVQNPPYSLRFRWNFASHQVPMFYPNPVYWLWKKKYYVSFCTQIVWLVVSTPSEKHVRHWWSNMFPVQWIQKYKRSNVNQTPAMGRKHTCNNKILLYGFDWKNTILYNLK